MLSLQDLLKLQKMIAETIDEKLKQFYEDHIKYLPTKEEHFKRMDTLSGEVKAMREAQELHSGDHSRLSDRLETVEKHLRIAPL